MRLFSDSKNIRRRGSGRQLQKLFRKRETRNISGVKNNDPSWNSSNRNSERIFLNQNLIQTRLGFFLSMFGQKIFHHFLINLMRFIVGIGDQKSCDLIGQKFNSEWKKFEILTE